MMSRQTIIGSLALGLAVAGAALFGINSSHSVPSSAPPEKLSHTAAPSNEGTSPEERALLQESPRQRANRHKEFLGRLEAVRQGIDANRQMAEAIAAADLELDKVIADAAALRSEATAHVKYPAEMQSLPAEAQEKLRQADAMESAAMDEHSKKLADLKQKMNQSSH